MNELKEIRKSSSYSQKELADKLGIKQQQYSLYETGIRKISLELFLKILEICNYKFTITKIKK